MKGYEIFELYVKIFAQMERRGEAGSALSKSATLLSALVLAQRYALRNSQVTKRNARISLQKVVNVNTAGIAYSDAIYE